jgi:hypothetical protein
MGGATFFDYSNITDTRQAFQALADDARYEHGSGGYSGTIAEKPGFSIIAGEPMPRVEAEALAQQLIDDNDHRIADKWGVAGAIAVASKSSFHRRSVQLTIPYNASGHLSVDQLKQLVTTLNGPAVQSGGSRDLLFGQRGNTLKPRLTLRDGERIETVKLLKERVTRKATSERTKGKVVTRYFIMRAGRIDIRGQGYDTMSAAHQALKTLMANRSIQLDQQKFSGPAEDERWEIVGLARRQDQTALASGTLAINKRQLSVEVSIIRPAAKVVCGGWLFFGWASY